MKLPIVVHIVDVAHFKAVQQFFIGKGARWNSGSTSINPPYSGISPFYVVCRKSPHGTRKLTHARHLGDISNFDKQTLVTSTDFLGLTKKFKDE